MKDDGPALLRSLPLKERRGAPRGAGARGGGPGLGSGGAMTDAVGRSGSGLVGVGGAGTEAAVDTGSAAYA